MILNQTSDVLLNAEQEMKNLCIAGRGQSCIIAFYDFYQLPNDFYIELKLKEAKRMEQETRKELPNGSKYYKVTAANLKGVIDDPSEILEVRLSVMSVEILNLFKQ